MQELVFAQTILELLAKYGVPAVIQIIKAWQIDDPTFADIDALKNAVPPGSSYFNDPGVVITGGGTGSTDFSNDG